MNYKRLNSWPLRQILVVNNLKGFAEITKNYVLQLKPLYTNNFLLSAFENQEVI